MLGVLFGLASALVWGSGDFAGGLAARRQHPLHVLVVAAFSGAVMLALFALLARDGMPSRPDVVWASVAGVCVALGIAALYRGLAIGNTARVAPLAAVIGAAMPVAAGFAIDARPSIAQLAGMAAALPGVYLTSRSQASSPGRSSGLFLACLAGLGFGGFLITIARVEKTNLFAPVLVARLVSLAVGLVLASIWRAAPLKPYRPGMAALAGCLDAGGNVFYVLATRYTRLDVAAVLSSLYPVATVGLSCWLLSEKATGTQWLGIALCLVGIALMSASS